MLEILFSLIVGIAIGVALTLFLTKKKKDDRQVLENTIKALASDALQSNNQQFLTLAKSNLENVLEKTKNEFGKQAINETLKPLREQIKNYDEEIKRIEQSRNRQYGGLTKQVDNLLSATQKLDKQTIALVNTLKRPEARGSLGEITLRRVVELAGMEKHVTFNEQQTIAESGLRPDMVVDLPNHRKIVIDSKVSLNPLLNAYEADSPEKREQMIAQYSKSVKKHIRDLATKRYWSQFEQSPEFVLMFMPGESFYFEAVRQEPELIEKAIEANVIIVTPFTLVALLRTVELGWQQKEISENARLVADMGAEMYERICKFSQFFSKIGDKFEEAIKTYNAGVGSFSSRIMPSARRLKDLSCSATRDSLEEPDPIDRNIRKLPEE